MFDMLQAMEDYGMTRKATVYDHERGLLFRAGRFVKILEPGYYNFWLDRKVRILKLDLRPNSIVVASQEIPTSDGVQVRVSLSTFYSIVDPKAHHDSSQNPQSSIYVELQMALREYVAGKSLDELLGASAGLEETAVEKCQSIFARYGCQMDSAGIRDISTGGDLKKAYAEVLKAKKLGEAALEKARGETAALRSLANAARLMAEQPALMQLRALQALSESPGSTLVLGSDALTVKKA